MEDLELLSLWKSQDEKLENLLAVNKQLAARLTKQELNEKISRLYWPKWAAILLGVPYLGLLLAVAVIAFMAEAYFVALGFGVIALLMAILILKYLYQVYLIGAVKAQGQVLFTQHQLSKLRVSSFQSIRLAVFQLPFWSICWVSITALKESPLLYGGVNLLVFFGLSYAAYWLYQQLSPLNKASKVRSFFLSGREWDPIVKSAELLEQLKAYER